MYLFQARQCIKTFIQNLIVLELRGLSEHLVDYTEMKFTTNYLLLKKQTVIVIETEKENVIL